MDHKLTIDPIDLHELDTHYLIKDRGLRTNLVVIRNNERENGDEGKVNVTRDNLYLGIYGIRIQGVIHKRKSKGSRMQP